MPVVTWPHGEVVDFAMGREPTSAIGQKRTFN